MGKGKGRKRKRKRKRKKKKKKDWEETKINLCMAVVHRISMNSWNKKFL